jgi:hypothetical protein
MEDNMKRQIIILATFIFCAALASAQTFPEDLCGDPLVLEVPLDIQMELIQFYDMSPWSMPSPVGAGYYLGDLRSNEAGAILRAKQYASKVCYDEDPPWGLHPDIDTRVCYAWSPRNLRQPRSWQMPWNEECGCYLNLNLSTGEFLSLTVDLEQEKAHFKQGFMNFEDGKWVYNSRRSIWTWLVEPRAVEALYARAFRVGGRVK